MLNRHNFQIEWVFLGMVTKKEMRYREATYEIGEQVGILGVVKNVEGDYSTYYVEPVSNKLLSHSTPTRHTHSLSHLFDVLKVSSISLSAEYIKEKQWSDFEQQSWQDMTAVPGILISEMAQDFQVCSMYVSFTVCSNRY